MFFGACDGFFTNYNWTEQSLEGMTGYSGLDGRQADVYVGVDVFARGKVVGGMWETNKVHTVGHVFLLLKEFSLMSVLTVEWCGDEVFVLVNPAQGLPPLKAMGYFHWFFHVFFTRVISTYFHHFMISEVEMQ